MLGAGPDAPVANAEIEEHRPGHDGDAPPSDAEAGAALFEEADYAGGGVEAEGAPAAEYDALRLLHKGIGA